VVEWETAGRRECVEDDILKLGTYGSCIDSWGVDKSWVECMGIVWAGLCGQNDVEVLVMMVSAVSAFDRF